MPKPIERPLRQPGLARARRPFWLPASNYYVLAAAVAIAFFFLVWGILHDGGDETPWVTAGIGASIILSGAVILRELVLRRARNRYLSEQRHFDRQLRQVYSRIESDRHSDKLTIEQNAEMLRNIERKSRAARTLGKFSAVHREVFELCGEYLGRNELELQNIGTGSPRLGPLRKSRDGVVQNHRFHLMKWAEIESRELTHEAKNRVVLAEKVEAAQSAINVIDAALAYYPNERDLLESRDVVLEMITSIKVSHWVEEAERAAFKGDYNEARSHYRDALFYLGRENVGSEDRTILAEKINREIERLRQLQSREES